MKKTILFLSLLISLTACQKSEVQQDLQNGSRETTITESFTVQSANGHCIGINGKAPEYSKYGQTSVNSCGSTTAPVVVAIGNVALSGPVFGCVLSHTWISGSGQCIALYIDGIPYKDGNSGYGLWSASHNGIVAEGRLIPGGINALQTFNSFIRTYCNVDTTGSPYFDSPIVTYAVPAAFVCTDPAIVNFLKKIKKK